MPSAVMHDGRLACKAERDDSGRKVKYACNTLAIVFARMLCEGRVHRGGLPESWACMSARVTAGAGGCAMRLCPMRSGGSWPGRSKPTTSLTPPDTVVQ